VLNATHVNAGKSQCVRAKQRNVSTEDVSLLSSGASRDGRGKRRPVAQEAQSESLIEFAPNFSVYLLPPDVVCLYSEDRKFFLHGALYQALAPAIASGKAIGSIVRELERDFPADKIHEAVQRLLERRFVVLTSKTSAGVNAAYWSSLGLAPDIAAANLAKVRVGIQSLGVEGADELAPALARLGVRMTKRSRDLTIVLVDDYLDSRLARWNEQRLADRMPWILVQASGAFPLVGPVFQPGKSACWSCLAQRMQRNREVKSFLDRKNATRIVTSPLVRSTIGQSGVHLAAPEIAKAIAADFRTGLRDHIISLDLLGTTVMKHYVATRPQCPSCGKEDLRDLGRAPEPIELETVGQFVMTSGGYRALSPAATVARYRKHVSPLTGVVSRLERIEADLPLNTNYFATHNFAARPDTIGELKAGLSGGSFGKGSSSDQGEASALMEAIERYSGSFEGDEIRSTGRFKDFRPGDAIHPNDVTLYSEAQYGRDAAPRMSPKPNAAVLTRFDEAARIEWSPLWSLRDEKFRYLPTNSLYFFYKGPGAELMPPSDSNGCAAGNLLNEAIVQGFLELVERDSYAIWWYNRISRPQIDLEQFADPYIRDLQTQFAQSGRKVWVLDITSDLEIPTFVAVSHWVSGSEEQLEFGSGAHFDPRIAVLRALTELNQFMSIGIMGCRSAGKLWSETGPNDLRLDQQPYLIPNDTSQIASKSDFNRLDSREQVLTCVRIAEQAGLDFLVLDQTRPDIGVPVVRVVVPGMRHFYRRFAPGRLYDVPVALGWRDKPLTERDLNPLHPRT
jgi:ribosomal protein S12 methylthiotransferase accessory factor